MLGAIPLGWLVCMTRGGFVVQLQSTRFFLIGCTIDYVRDKLIQYQTDWCLGLPPTAAELRGLARGATVAVVKDRGPCNILIYKVLVCKAKQDCFKAPRNSGPSCDGLQQKP